MEIQGRIWIKNHNINFLGHGKIELLERIKQTGSIAKAAKEMKMSYKAAWDSIDMINKASKEPLVVAMSGGKGGGGTQITPNGEEAIRIFKAMEEKQNQLLQFFKEDLKSWQESQEHPKDAQKIDTKAPSQKEVQSFVRKYVMKTSARNQLFGKIVEIKEGKVNAHITLETTSNLKIKSIITLTSLKELSLQIGTQCYALVKSSWIVVFTQKPKKCSLQNCLEGRVAQIKEGEVNCQVEIDSFGTPLCAIITEESYKDFGIKVGDKVWFGFKANNVILAI